MLPIVKKLTPFQARKPCRLWEVVAFTIRLEWHLGDILVISHVHRDSGLSNEYGVELWDSLI